MFHEFPSRSRAILQCVFKDGVATGTERASQRNTSRPMLLRGSQGDSLACLEEQQDDALGGYANRQNNGIVTLYWSLFECRTRQGRFRSVHGCSYGRLPQKSSEHAFTLLQTKTRGEDQNCIKKKKQSFRRSITMRKRKEFCKEDVFFRYEQIGREMCIRPYRAIPHSSKAELGRCGDDLASAFHMHQGLPHCDNKVTECIQDASYEASALEEVEAHRRTTSSSFGGENSDKRTFEACKVESIRSARGSVSIETGHNSCTQTSCSDGDSVESGLIALGTLASAKKDGTQEQEAVQGGDYAEVARNRRSVWKNISAFLKKYICCYSISTCQ